MLLAKTTKNAKKASRAIGTWKYMMRCTSPCTASVGASTNAAQMESIMPMATAPPSMYSPYLRTGPSQTLFAGCGGDCCPGAAGCDVSVFIGYHLVLDDELKEER